MLELWEITTPLKSNDGKSYAEAQRYFASELLALFGGYTSRDCNGAWRDQETGRDYIEPVRVYSVLCEAEPAFLALARPWFPDQIMFMVARVGEGKLIAP